MPSSNDIPEFSVSTLAEALKRTLEGTYGHIRVRGELSRVTLHSSGHLYTTLKDSQAVIDAVCWRGTLAGLSIKPTEGMEVICTGRVSSYPKSSKYQLIIEGMEIAGAGALLSMLEARKKALAEKGVFALDRKKPLPFLPEIIGVITSPTGAVIRDIYHRIADRFPRHILVWPVAVQGSGSAAQIAAGIAGFDSLQGLLRPDVIIVARGGGSLEDLMPFNEESVVYAAAACRIPLISAVGHETDTTLLDYVADVRAPTPSAAAEMAVPVRTDILTGLDVSRTRLRAALRRIGGELRHRLATATATLTTLTHVLETSMQSLDILTGRLARGYRVDLNVKIAALEALRLSSPLQALERAQISLNHAARMLESLSFERVLERGFVLVRSSEGVPLTRAKDTHVNQCVHLNFAGGEKRKAIITQD